MLFGCTNGAENYDCSRRIATAATLSFVDGHHLDLQLYMFYKCVFGIGLAEDGFALADYSASDQVWFYIRSCKPGLQLLLHGC